ncbi:hypothetical protein QBC40DRAFT_301141 [Triangularia verruculosa]|uniref:Uncharacterized protein n=1 Tax=Triangularia verruculosa TaxID=2587418 RepID=A0AAN7AR55_9PEZI|nr:hypothetical protein QBC40DRAFT_301141 [Triangularia verruculosa]
MPAHIKTQEKGRLLLLLTGNASNEEIRATLGLSIRQIQRYRKTYQITGSPFTTSRTTSNAQIFTPYLVEKTCQLLAEKPSFYLDELQWFLVLEYHVFFNRNNILAYIRRYYFTEGDNNFILNKFENFLRRGVTEVKSKAIIIYGYYRKISSG